MRSAVFLPIPGCASAAPFVAADRIDHLIGRHTAEDVIASLGPMPLTVMSFSNSFFSAGRRKP